MLKAVWIFTFRPASGPITFSGEQFATFKCQNIDYFLLTIIFIYGSAKKPDEKKSKEDGQTLAELSSAHRRSRTKRHLVETTYQPSSVGLYGRIFTSAVLTDHTAFGLHSRPRSKFSHTDLLLS